MIGRLLLRFNQALEKRRYTRLLLNGGEVLEQLRCQNQTHLIDHLAFRGGPTFVVRDGASAAHTFKEIFIQQQYGEGRLLERLIKSRVVVDVGANIGLFAYYALQKAQDARLYAFEADPDTFRVFEENLSRLSGSMRDRVSALHRAVASEAGTVPFFSSEVSGWSSRYAVLGAKDGTKVEVPSLVLSEFLRESRISRIDFLKIDVEGAEYDILMDDESLLQMEIGTLVVEADREPRAEGYSYEDLLRRLRERFGSVEVMDKNGSLYPLIICS